MSGLMDGGGLVEGTTAATGKTAAPPRQRSGKGAAAGPAKQTGAHKPETPAKQAGPAKQTSAAALAAELRVAVMRTSRRLRNEAAAADLTPGQYSVLAGILKGPLTVGQLAERERIQAPSMTRIVNSLTAAGHVTREENPQDRRQVLVQISEQGAAVLREARSRRTQWLAKRVAALTAEQRATLHEAALILQEMSAS